jgi:hypothetical protein
MRAVRVERRKVSGRSRRMAAMASRSDTTTKLRFIMVKR